MRPRRDPEVQRTVRNLRAQLRRRLAKLSLVPSKKDSRKALDRMRREIVDWYKDMVAKGVVVPIKPEILRVAGNKNIKKDELYSIVHPIRVPGRVTCL